MHITFEIAFVATAKQNCFDFFYFCTGSFFLNEEGYLAQNTGSKKPRNRQQPDHRNSVFSSYTQKETDCKCYRNLSTSIKKVLVTLMLSPVNSDNLISMHMLGCDTTLIVKRV